MDVLKVAKKLYTEGERRYEPVKKLEGFGLNIADLKSRKQALIVDGMVYAYINSEIFEGSEVLEFVLLGKQVKGVKPDSKGKFKVS
jgi:hypothetical protein